MPQSDVIDDPQKAQGLTPKSKMDQAHQDELATTRALTRERARRAARGHTRAVRFLRRFIPLLSLALALGVVGHILLERALIGLPLGLGGLSLSGDGFVMDAPSLSGSDAAGRLYTISAERAVQSLTDPGLIVLERIQADIQMDEGTKVTFTAAKGHFRMQKDLLSLSGGLEIRTSSGDVARMDKVDINLKTGAADAPSSISIQSDIGDISANRFSVRDGGQIIRFDGDIRMTIRPDRIDMLKESPT